MTFPQSVSVITRELHKKSHHLILYACLQNRHPFLKVPKTLFVRSSISASQPLSICPLRRRQWRLSNLSKSLPFQTMALATVAAQLMIVFLNRFRQNLRSAESNPQALTQRSPDCSPDRLLSSLPRRWALCAITTMAILLPQFFLYCLLQLNSKDRRKGRVQRRYDSLRCHAGVSHLSYSILSSITTY